MFWNETSVLRELQTIEINTYRKGKRHSKTPCTNFFTYKFWFWSGSTRPNAVENVSGKCLAHCRLGHVAGILIPFCTTVWFVLGAKRHFPERWSFCSCCHCPEGWCQLCKILLKFILRRNTVYLVNCINVFRSVLQEWFNFWIHDMHLPGNLQVVLNQVWSKLSQAVKICHFT